MEPVIERHFPVLAIAISLAMFSNVVNLPRDTLSIFRPGQSSTPQQLRFYFPRTFIFVTVTKSLVFVGAHITFTVLSITMRGQWSEYLLSSIVLSCIIDDVSYPLLP